MSIAALFGVIWHFSKDEFIPYLKEKAVPFLKKHWKQIIAFILLCWTIMCLLTHCSGVIDPWGHHSTNDTIRTVDTVMVYPDTAAIFALHGFDTLPKYVRHIENRLRFKPAPPVFSVDASCRDSLVVMRSHSELLTEILSDCDSAYGDAVAVRSYGDTLRNDSIEVAVNFRVEGRLKGVPSIRYRHLAPYPVVTVTETVTNTVGPYRKVYLEGGLGPDMTWDNNLNAIRGSLGAGYTDKSNWSYGVRAGFTQNGCTVEGAVRKSFDLKKK
jgi:hypothetical protein